MKYTENKSVAEYEDQMAEKSLAIIDGLPSKIMDLIKSANEDANVNISDKNWKYFTERFEEILSDLYFHKRKRLMEVAGYRQEPKLSDGILEALNPKKNPFLSSAEALHPLPNSAMRGFTVSGAMREEFEPAGCLQHLFKDGKVI